MIYKDPSSSFNQIKDFKLGSKCYACQNCIPDNFPILHLNMATWCVILLHPWNDAYIHDLCIFKCSFGLWCENITYYISVLYTVLLSKQSNLCDVMVSRGRVIEIHPGGITIVIQEKLISCDCKEYPVIQHGLIGWRKIIPLCISPSGIGHNAFCTVYTFVIKYIMLNNKLGMRSSLYV